MYRLLTPVHSFPKYHPHSFSVFVTHLSPVNSFPEVHPSPHPRKTSSCTNSVSGKQNCLPKWKDMTSVHQEAQINNGILQAENQYFQISRIYIIIVLFSFSTFFSFSTWRDDCFLFQYSKGKAVPLQTRSGPEGSRKLKFPDFMTTA